MNLQYSRGKWLNEGCYFKQKFNNFSYSGIWFIIQELLQKSCINLNIVFLSQNMYSFTCIHHNLFITLLLGSKPISVLAIQTYYNESKMHKFYRKS